MIIELGHFTLILALLLASGQVWFGLRAAKHDHPGLLQLARRVSLLQFLLLLIAFGVLMQAYIRSDFSVLNVTINSHVAKPLLYKISGVWGNHEGSMLLWVLILALFGAAIAFSRQAIEPVFRARVIAVQGAVSFLFLGFLLFTSNPFIRLFPAPFSGQGLNPVLQDPALAAHPPMLYVGYVGFSLVFAFAVAALMGRELPLNWARLLRPWILIAWIFLTIGIALGSYWAYYELGWGGFWFWDPVENASLMPWLSGTALLHSALVTQQRDLLKSWTILLAILTFGLSLVGAFLVRSGILTSVHAFANDPARGVYILLILVLIMATALWLYARASRYFSASEKIMPLSRETALVVNNVFLVTAVATVFIGTLYPLFLDALGGAKISVGAPYFSAVFLPLMVPFVILLPFGPFLRWRNGMLALRHLSLPLLAALLVGGGIFLGRGADMAVSFAVAGSIWLIMGGGADIAMRLRLYEGDVIRKLIKARLIHFASGLAHAGIGVMLLGIIGATAWKEEVVVAIAPQDIIEIGHYKIRFAGVKKTEGKNYQSSQATLTYVSGPHNFGTLTPERRFYPVERNQTTEAAIYKRLDQHLYAVLGESADGKYIIRIWLHPLVMLIWIGAGFMAVGGLCRLTEFIRPRNVKNRQDI